MDLTLLLKNCLGVHRVEKVATLQSLWSGYGEIARFHLYYDSACAVLNHEQKEVISNNQSATFLTALSDRPTSIIVKHIHPKSNKQHPKGWNTQTSFNRKLISYNVESHWYQKWAPNCNESTPLPRCYGVIDHTFYPELALNEKIILLSDLDALGYSLRLQKVNLAQAQACLSWLAYFHGQFLCYRPDKTWVDALWQKGTYWHLATRKEEFNAMPDSLLKGNAMKIDRLLSSCLFQTLLHGDAKVANFCFTKDNKVAAVDFQYVGAGCGMKDVMYFIGSALTEAECDRYCDTLLNYYFNQLKQAIHLFNPQINTVALECEWRNMFIFAWADFQRFLIGWSAAHPKNNSFSQKMTQQALLHLSKI